MRSRSVHTYDVAGSRCLNENFLRPLASVQGRKHFLGAELHCLVHCQRIIFDRLRRPSFWVSGGVCWPLATYLPSKRLLWCTARFSFLQISCRSTKMQISEVRTFFFQCTVCVLNQLKNLGSKWRFLSSHEKTLLNICYGQSMFLRCMPYTYGAQWIQMKYLLHMFYNCICINTHANCNFHGCISR